MNWLQKISQRDASFFLLGDELIVFPELHEQYLARTLGVSTEEAVKLRFVLPRGRAVRRYDGVIIEASSELEPYRHELVRELGLTPMDRPKWDFNDQHYEVTNSQVMSGLWFKQFSPQAMKFLEKYAPELTLVETI